MRKVHLVIDGLLIGLTVFEAIVIYRMKKTCGILQIDTKGEKDLYRFDVDDLDGLSKKKYVRVKVNPNADLSQN